MRLFTAIDLPAETCLRLERLLSALRPEAPIKWSPLDNLHITTKFIGEWPEQRLEEIHDALAQVGPREPFEISLHGLGWYPNAHAPRVLWVGVDAGPELAALVQQIEQRLEAIGVAKEGRPFAPHLTLARIKHPAPLQALRQKVERLQPADLGRFPVAGFSLFRSDPGSNASVYRKLRDYRLEVALAAH
jgi:RNA 2',3'-cyclic 3'-phosphodiesterase